MKDMSVEMKSHYFYFPEYKEKLNFAGELIYAADDYKLNLNYPVRFERYGGVGADGHGGGGRTAVLDDFQVKGCGITPLAGKVDNPNYSHGKLTLADGVYEILYSNLLNNVMPLGTVECLALLYTGKYSAFEYSRDNKDLKPTHGALLIRKNAQRPANFLPTRNYIANERYKDAIGSDVDRLRQVYSELACKFKGQSAFIQYLGKFLSNSANQFAFARVAGIFHAGISHSNLSTDGKWLDLSTATFVDKSRNYISEHISFYHESEIIIDVIQEWVATYAKYQKASLDIVPLVNYYLEQLQAYQEYHSVYLLGLDRKAFFELGELIEFKPICQDLLSLLFPIGRTYTIEQLRPKTDNKLVNYILKLYGGALKYHGGKKASETDLLFERIYSDCNQNCNITKGSFFKRSGIKALKRAILPGSFFYIPVKCNILNNIKEDPYGADGVIEGYESLAAWVFDDEFTNKEILFENTIFSINYDLISDEVELVSHAEGSAEIIKDFSIMSDRLTHNLINPLLLNYYWSKLEVIFDGVGYEK